MLGQPGTDMAWILPFDFGEKSGLHVLLHAVCGKRVFNLPPAHVNIVATLTIDAHLLM